MCNLNMWAEQEMQATHEIPFTSSTQRPVNNKILVIYFLLHCALEADNNYSHESWAFVREECLHTKRNRFGAGCER